MFLYLVPVFVDSVIVMVYQFFDSLQRPDRFSDIGGAGILFQKGSYLFVGDFFSLWRFLRLGVRFGRVS
jgi:hypothetical protein